MNLYIKIAIGAAAYVAAIAFAIALCKAAASDGEDW